jgi:esterase/lipase superfamily enzyme
MAEFPSPALEYAVPIIAGVLYALIWYATRRLSGFAKLISRVLPLLIILPAILYVSFGVPLPRQVEEVLRIPPVERTRTSRDVQPSPRQEVPPPVGQPAPPPKSAEAPPPPAPGSGRRSLDTTDAKPKAPPAAGSETDKSGGPAPGVPAAPDTHWDIVPVFYGTDRTRKEEPKRITYTSERGRRLELGRALVTVPKVHQVPTIERPFAIRVPFTNVVIYEQAEDPAKHFTISELKALSQEQFLALVRERIAGGRAFKDQAVVFVHGYNTDFDYALFRTAQMAYDLKFDGASFLYSWPSGGGVASYGYDRESATQAVQYLQDFLTLVLKESGAKSVSVIAHSMGNLPLLEVLRSVGPTLPPDVRLNEIILAAPDVDRDVFAYLAANVKQYGRGVTLYCSATDRAMAVARRVAGGIPRAGDVPADGPIIVSGIDTIDVSQTSMDVLALNHSVYAENNALLNDIALLLRTGERPPELRVPILQKVSTPKGDTFWRYPLR